MAKKKKKNGTRAIMSMSPARFERCQTICCGKGKVGLWESGLYRTRQECMWTYALWSGFRKKKFIKGTIKPHGN